MNNPRAPHRAGRGRPVRPPRFFGSQHPNHVKRDVSIPFFEPQAYQGNSSPFPPQLGASSSQFPAPVNLMNQNPNTPLIDNGQLLMNLLNMLAQQRPDPRLAGMNPQMAFANSFPRNGSQGPTYPNSLNQFPGQFPAPSFTGFGQPQHNHALAVSSMNTSMQNFGCGLTPQHFDSRGGNFGIPSASNQPVNPPLLNLVQNLLLAGQANQNQLNVGTPSVTGKNAPGPHSMQSQPDALKMSVPQPFNNSLNASHTQHSGNIGPRNFRAQRFGINDRRREWKNEAQRFGPQRNQFRQQDNRKRSFENFERGNRKGFGHSFERRGKPGFERSSNGAPEPNRKTFIPSYSEQEIAKWREDRKKNFPSKENLERKSQILNSDVLKSEDKLRREQLKEILDKQAELGVEVAEIPSHYLGDSDTRTNGNLRNKRIFNKRGNGKFKNNRDKRKNNRQHFVKNKDPSFKSHKEPTLLQKLLNADIQREKRQLLQALRFILSNSFFKNCPETPLQFPEIKVNESAYDLSRENISEEISPKNVNLDDDRLICARGVIHSELQQKDSSNVDDAEEGEIID